MASSLLTGRLAADTNADKSGSGIAEIMGMPSVTIARKVEIGDGKVRVEPSQNGANQNAQAVYYREGGKM